MEQHDYERLEELGQLLFQEGAFFSSMSENEKEWFGEALQLLAKKEAEKVMQEQCPCNTGECCDGESSPEDLAKALNEAVNVVKNGFNVNVNVTPNWVDDSCKDVCYNDYNEDDIKDEYYSNMKETIITDGTYMPEPDDEMINDGTYPHTDHEVYYGEEGEVKPEDEWVDESKDEDGEEPMKGEEPK